MEKRNCVVLVVAILSTFSTTGYIIATVVCVYKSIKSNSQYSVIRLIKRLCVPVMICVVLIIANSLIQEKLSNLFWYWQELMILCLGFRALAIASVVRRWNRKYESNVFSKTKLEKRG